MMNGLSLPSRCLLFLIWMALLIGWKINLIGSLSVDLAHHYALVERLAEKWWLPPASDPAAAALDWRSLGEMIIYPAASHRLAAVLGRLFQSSFIGMQATALAALAIIWGVIAGVLFSLPRSTAVAAGLFTAGLAGGAHFIGLPIHGGEIAGPFFFAQLVGQAVALLCLAAWIFFERDGADWRRRYGLMLAGPALTVSFHLLPALALLGFFGCVVVFELLLDPPSQRWGRFVRRGLVVLAAAALTAFHPAFRAMLTIAGNNGHLPIVYFSGIGSFVVLAIIVAGLAAANLVAWRRLEDEKKRQAHAPLKYLALFATAVSLLCLMQVAASFIGAGNDYAVRKHIFALLSFALIEAATLAALMLGRRPGWEQAAHRLGPLEAVGPVALLTLGFAFGGPSQPAPMTAAAVINLERQIKALKDARTPWSEKSYDVAVRLAGMPPVIDYMLSLGVLRTHRDANAAAILTGGDLQELDKIGTIITSRAAAPYDVPSCRLFTARSGLTLIDAACFQNGEPHQGACNGQYDFTATAAGAVYQELLSGFSGAEEAGRWTDGFKAGFRCDQPDGGGASRVRLEMSPFLAPANGLTSQRLTIKINGQVAVSHVFSQPGEIKTFDVPLALSPGGIEITLETPDAAAPKDVGVSEDPRRLGVQVRRISFQ